MWTGNVYLSCSSMQRIYCFGIAHNTPVAPAQPDPGTMRLGFVSQQTWVPGGGLTAADDVCAQDAAGACAVPVALVLGTAALALASVLRPAPVPAVAVAVRAAAAAQDAAPARRRAAPEWRLASALRLRRR